MSYIEAAFISRPAYEALEDERLQGEELEVAQLYVAMFALVGNPDNREAAKLPVSFQDIAEIERGSGRWMASLAVLNVHGGPSVETVGEFDDGYWTDVNARLHVVDATADTRYGVDEGYVRTFDPDMDADLLLTHDRAFLMA